jgi:hypothetical protein
MVRRGVDRRRRTLLRLAAAGLGIAGTDTHRRRTPAVDSGGEPPVRDAVEAEIVVHGEEGTTHVRRRGDDEPMFTGTASAALQRAVDAGAASGSGAAIAVAPGRYRLERPVTLAPSVWLSGAGAATTLRAGDDAAKVLSVPAGAEHVRISDLVIDGGAAPRADGVVVGGGAWRPVIEHLVVRGMSGHGIRFTGGPDGEYSYEPTLADIDVARCDGDGFVFGHVGDVFGQNLYAEACGQRGFTMADAGGTLVHAHAYDTRGEAGLRVTESGRDLVLLGPHLERNRRHGGVVKGDRVTIHNGFIVGNSRADAGSYAGLVLDGATDALVSGSRFHGGDSGSQGYGLVETADSRDNRVTGNWFRGNRTGAVRRGSRETGSVFRENRGYPTEGGGTAEVADGGTIAHGLAERPRRFRVDATEPGVYAHAIDADASRLRVEALRLPDADPVDEPIRIHWSATV